MWFSKVLIQMWLCYYHYVDREFFSKEWTMGLLQSLNWGDHFGSWLCNLLKRYCKWLVMASKIPQRNSNCPTQCGLWFVVLSSLFKLLMCCWYCISRKFFVIVEFVIKLWLIWCVARFWLIVLLDLWLKMVPGV